MGKLSLGTEDARLRLEPSRSLSWAGWMSRSLGLLIAIITLLVLLPVYMSADTLCPYSGNELLLNNKTSNA
jgi:hypothetical protein